MTVFFYFYLAKDYKMMSSLCCKKKKSGFDLYTYGLSKKDNMNNLFCCFSIKFIDIFVFYKMLKFNF